MKKIFDDFVKQADSQELQIEGFYVLQGGKAVYEHRWAPDRARNIYSNTKSFVSTAIGIAVGEGVLSLEDRLVDIFPQKVPEGGNPGLERITLRHLLTMSSGFGRALLMMGDRSQGVGFPDYLQYMMSQPVICEPGSEFCYSSADSYLAGRMLEARLGRNLQEYMYERLLRPMSIPLPIWQSCPMGHPLGGGGMFLRLTDMAKLGQLYLDGGVWEGHQLVPAEWVREASRKQIDNFFPREREEENVPKSPWHEWGYGYQFWLSEYPGSFRADGAFGQITMVLPKLELVIAVQCPEEGDFGRVQEGLDQMIRRLMG